jgi:inosine-uridine nucleoside N-ribohydrolase
MANRQTRRRFLGTASVYGATAIGSGLPGRDGVGATAKRPTAQETFGLLKAGKRIPVIYDTDIGDDIDDTWALIMLLNSPELEPRLIVTDGSHTTYRARLTAKLLAACGRTDVPIGIGFKKGDKTGPQSEWLGDYQLDQYNGTVYEDGVAALIRAIKSSAEPVTLICVGPVPNIAEALRRDPEIADNARFVGMHGSIRIGYGGSSKPVAEYNVRAAPKALQAVFAAPWDITITPLDTCGLVVLDGANYQRIRQSKSPAARVLMDNYDAWARFQNRRRRRRWVEPQKRSSTLFDTVAIYLGYSEELVKMEHLHVKVTDKGMTVVDPAGPLVHCATAWKDLDKYERHLTDRIVRA